MAKYKIDKQRLEQRWKDQGFKSLKDVFKDSNGDENAFMRYDSANKHINSGEISGSIMLFLCKQLNCPIEYLTGALTDKQMADINDWIGFPDISFSYRQQLSKLTPEEKEKYFTYELFDLGIYHEWMDLDTMQRKYCHTAIYEFSNWLLNYVDPDKEGYEEIFDFFSKTGVTMDPDLRKELFKTLTVTYKTFMQMHTKK